MTAYRFTGIAAGLVLGIVLATYTVIALPTYLLITLFIVGAGFFAAAWRAERRWIEWPRTIIFLSALLLSLPLGYTRTQSVLKPAHPHALRSRLAAIERGDRLELRGIIAVEPEWRGRGQVDLTVRVQEMRLADSTDDTWIPVARLGITSRLRRPHRTIGNIPT